MSKELVRTPATVVWLALIMATLVSWALGSERSLDNSGQSFASVTILVIAFVKVRFIGLYFMDLKDAPAPLRAAFEFYCVAVCVMTIAMFTLA